MNPFRADLHMHSTYSDGSLTPTEIIHLAKESGLSALSITDHDTVEAYAEAIPKAAEAGLQILTGVEFSAARKEASVHILGYGFKLGDPYISSFCERHKNRRHDRNLAILSLLAKHGMPIKEADLYDAIPMAAQNRIIGRPHIAMAMVKKGYVDSVQEAFKNFLREDKPCYSSGTSFSIEETIDIIHRAKGIAVIAHPHLLHNPSLLNTLVEMNFDGIECYYGKFPEHDNRRWLRIAQKKEWLVTGGSDFHGSIKPGLELGCSYIDREMYEKIQYRLKLPL